MAKRKRGRPRIKKLKKFKIVHKKCKRGRPKGSKNKQKKYKMENGPKMADLPKDYKIPTTKKFLGYCKCGSIIIPIDLKSTNVFICPSCNLRGKTKSLKRDKKIDGIKSKKEYLQELKEINVKFHDMPSLETSAEDILNNKGGEHIEQKLIEVDDITEKGDKDEDSKKK